MVEDNKSNVPTSARSRKGGRGVTMEDVGKLAGVTQVTVSRALSNPDKVSAKTLQKIQDAIDATGFVPNALAGALASQRSKLISVLVPSITTVTYTSMIAPFISVMREQGYEILLSETGLDLDDEEKVITAHISRRPDAILLTGVHHSVGARKKLLGAQVPVIELWDITESPIDICVGFEQSRTGIDVAEYALKAGYTHAWTVSALDERAQRRKLAFANKFEAVTGNKVEGADFAGAASLENGRQGLATLHEAQPDQKRIVFCSSDILAHGVMIEARSRGLRVPEDVAVVGFGDQAFAPHLNPPLTTVRVDRDALGRAAAEKLIARFSGQSPQGGIVDVGFEIIQRASTAQ